MGITNIIYLSEIILAILFAIIGIIVLKSKHKKGCMKLLAFVLVFFIIIFSISFILERPYIKVDDVQIIETGSTEKIKSPNTTYHFQNVTDKVKVKEDINYQKAGEYDVEYEIYTFIGKYTKKVKVKVVDTEVPEIILTDEEDYKLSYKSEYKEPGVKAIDKNDGDLTNKIVTSQENIDETHFNVKYEVIDSAGNKAEKTRKVTIIDDIPPVITLNDSKSITLNVNDKYEEKGAKAVDEKDGDLTSKIEISGEVNTAKEGTYTITYKVSDNSGNVVTEQRTITVISKEKQANNNSNTKKIQNSNNNNANINQNPTPVNPAPTNTGKGGVIYLTFDDGPSSNITPRVLDILKQKGVKATFFIINYDSSKEYLVKREYSEGHTVAIHGYSHDYATIYKSEEAYMSNITKLQEKIKKTTGYNATITRFPGGSSNTVSKNYNKGIMTRLTKLVLSKGYKYFDWNVSSGDAGGVSNSNQLYYNVINGVKPNRNNVVLMHDFSSNSKLLDALPRIIDWGKANGYTFERITTSTPMVTHGVNN